MNLLLSAAELSPAGPLIKALTKKQKQNNSNPTLVDNLLGAAKNVAGNVAKTVSNNLNKNTSGQQKTTKQQKTNNHQQVKQQKANNHQQVKQQKTIKQQQTNNHQQHKKQQQTNNHKQHKKQQQQKHTTTNVGVQNGNNQKNLNLQNAINTHKNYKKMVQGLLQNPNVDQKIKQNLKKSVTTVENYTKEGIENITTTITKNIKFLEQLSKNDKLSDKESIKSVHDALLNGTVTSSHLQKLSQIAKKIENPQKSHDLLTVVEETSKLLMHNKNDLNRNEKQKLSSLNKTAGEDMRNLSESTNVTTKDSLLRNTNVPFAKVNQAHSNVQVIEDMHTKKNKQQKNQQ